MTQGCIKLQLLGKMHGALLAGAGMAFQREVNIPIKVSKALEEGKGSISGQCQR